MNGIEVYSGQVVTLSMGCAAHQVSPPMVVSSDIRYGNDCGPEARSAARAFTEHVVLGRWAEVRLPSRQELQELWYSLPLTEASAKVRTGPSTLMTR